VETESHEIIYFKVYKGQIPVIEQALETAALMLGSDKSRGYCLEMICADFLAGANLDNGNPEILLHSIRQFSSSCRESSGRRSCSRLVSGLREHSHNQMSTIPTGPRIIQATAAEDIRARWLAMSMLWCTRKSSDSPQGIPQSSGNRYG
jgi:hypothetical protein